MSLFKQSEPDGVYDSAFVVKGKKSLKISQPKRAQKFSSALREFENYGPPRGVKFLTCAIPVRANNRTRCHRRRHPVVVPGCVKMWKCENVKMVVFNTTAGYITWLLATTAGRQLRAEKFKNQTNVSLISPRLTLN